MRHQYRVVPAGAPPSLLPEEGMQAAERAYREKRLDDAAALCRSILAADPAHADAHHLLGVVLSDLGQNAAALVELRRAVALDSTNARARYHLGNALLALGEPAEAEASFRTALILAPTFSDARNNLGNALRAQERHEEAITCFRALLSVKPGYPPPLYNMGRSLAQLGRYAEAVACFREALASCPRGGPADRFADVADALAAALSELGLLDEALDACRLMQRLKPDDPQPVWNESLALLALGRYAEAWPKYERRWLLPKFRDEAEADEPPPVLSLCEIAGQRVLIRSEQGRGDVIQFARYAPLVAKRARTTVLSVPEDLTALIASLSGVRVIDDEATPPAHDLATSLLSLPQTFGTEMGSIPASVPYLHPPRARLSVWSARLGPRKCPRIGLCWRGAQHIPERSIPLASLQPLLDIPGLAFHALQKEPAEAERGLLATEPRITDHGPELGDFADTAALAALMDLIVTIDTSVAHLAGALARPVWIMLRRNADWRWLLGRTDSPWYPTARLFRQGADGLWPPVIEAVACALRERFGVAAG